MTKTTGTYYELAPDGRVRLSIQIGSAGLATTTVSVQGELVVEAAHDHVGLDLGLAADLDLVAVRCHTLVKAAPPGTVNRVDYELTGGDRPWTATLREDPPDPAYDVFIAEFVLYRP